MILSNQIHCNACGDEPFSTHVHDYKSCQCGAVAVDGGMHYLRRTFRNAAEYTEMSIEIPMEAKDAAIKAIKGAIDTGRNELGILCAVAIALRDNGVKWSNT